MEELKSPAIALTIPDIGQVEWSQPDMTKYTTSNRYRSPLADKDTLQKAVVGAKSKKDVLINLGLRAAGGNYANLDEWAKRHGIELPVSVPDATRTLAARMANRTPDCEVFVEDSTFNSSGSIKQRLRERGYPQQCAICGQGDEWNGKPLVLQLDHINGRNSDNRIENLRLLCPNCHAQTFSFRGYNTKPKKKCECGKTINAASKHCRKCSAERRGSVTTHCPRGHELIAPNLRPSALKSGKRICLACDRARGYCISHGIMDQYQQVSDRYFTEIMNNESVVR